MAFVGAIIYSCAKHLRSHIVEIHDKATKPPNISKNIIVVSL